MQGGQLLPHGAALCGCVGVLMWFSGSRQRLIASKLDEGSTEGRRRRCSHGRAAVRRRGRVIAPGGLVAGAAAAERGPPRRGVCTRPRATGRKFLNAAEACSRRDRDGVAARRGRGDRAVAGSGGCGRKRPGTAGCGKGCRRRLGQYPPGTSPGPPFCCAAAALGPVCFADASWAWFRRHFTRSSA